MVEKEQKYSASNGGYSLVELIVTILISGVVMLAVMGFLTSGLNHYRNVNSETLLQMESQMTELFVTELIQESTDFQMVDSADFPAGGNVSKALEVTKGTDIYMLALIGNELRFAKVNAADTPARLAQLVAKTRGETFLAQYVTDFNLPLGAQSFADAEMSAYKGTMVLIDYQVDQKTYSSSSLIMLRNTERN